MNKKRIVPYLALLAFLMSIFTACSIATSQEIPMPTVEKNVYIYDDDNVISDDVEHSLNQSLISLEEETEIEFAVISVKSLLNKDIESYANKVFNTLEIGKKDKDNGILLLFSRSDSRVRLEIGRGLEGILPDSKCGRILDNYFVPYRDEDNYTQATKLTVQAVLNVISDKYNTNISGLEDISLEDPNESDPLFVWISIILLIIVIFVLALIVDNDSDGPFSGTFGGSSGGSSGGFGGGFSGGGGASR